MQYGQLVVAFFYHPPYLIEANYSYSSFLICLFQFNFIMQQLNSQVSYMTVNQALLTFYADYIVGWHANYQKWYFATQLNLDNAVEQAHNLSLQYL